MGKVSALARAERRAETPFNAALDRDSLVLGSICPLKQSAYVAIPNALSYSRLPMISFISLVTTSELVNCPRMRASA